MLQKESFELLASLDQGFEWGPLDSKTEIEGQGFYVNTVGGKQFNVGVVYEGDAIHIDYPKVWGMGFDFPDVDHFIYVFLSLHGHLKSTYNQDIGYLQKLHV